MAESNPVQVAGFTFAGEIIRPEHPEYNRRRAVRNGIIDRRPTFILRAGNSSDVSAAIRLAAKGDLPPAVRCGGHSFPGYSTCDEGIVLDLSLMRAITINPIERIAKAEGGALLGDLDKAGNPYGLVTPAGVVGMFDSLRARQCTREDGRAELSGAALRRDLSVASASAANFSAVSNRFFRNLGHQEERASVVACRAAARSSWLLNGLDITLERRSWQLVLPFREHVDNICQGALVRVAQKRPRRGLW